MSDIVERLRTTWSVSVEHSTNPWLSELNVEGSASDIALEAADEIARLRAEVERLREALKPFADAADEAIDESDLDKWDAWDHACAMAVTIGDFRRAFEALAAEEQGDD